MATSGSFNTSAYSGRYLTFAWSIKSQDVAANKTVINWSLKGAGGDSTWYKSGNFKVVIAGVTVYSSATRIQLSKGTTVASGTYTFVHNNDGTKSFTASAEAGIYTTAVNCTGSGSFTLDTIPRASQPSLVTWPETTNNVGEFGAEFSIHMNRKSDAFTHTVRYAYGNRTGTIATGVTTGTTWAVPLSFMNDIPNATSASGLIYVDTYNGSTKVGTKYTGFTVTVPASVKPSVKFTLEDITGIDDIYGSPVQGLSKIKITATPTLAYSSPIVSYTITADGKTYTAATATTGALQASGSSNVFVTIKDKRGRTASAGYTMSVQAYALPRITKLAVHRVNQSGEEDDQGEYISAEFAATITSLNSKNTANYSLRYKKTTDTEWTTYNYMTSWAGRYQASGSVNFAADSSSSYDVELEAKDSHGTATRSTSASTAFTLMNWGADGTSMGIGKVAEKANTLQIALDTEFIGKVSGAIFDAIYPVGSIYMAYNHTNPATLFGGTWTRLTGGFLWASQAGDTIGQTGGEKTHKLTVAELPAHNHGGTYTNAGTATKTHAWLASGGSAMAYDIVEAGGGVAHNNMPPYIQVSIWRRTA